MSRDVTYSFTLILQFIFKIVIGNNGIYFTGITLRNIEIKPTLITLFSNLLYNLQFISL